MLRHPGASAVVPFLDDPRDADPRVLLIRQFRHAADGFIWEVPAGRLDPARRPRICARRELEEETGLLAGAIERLTTIYTTPGFTDERIHLFLARGLETGVRAARGGRVHGSAPAAVVAGGHADPVGGDPGCEDFDSTHVCSMF